MGKQARGSGYGRQQQQQQPQRVPTPPDSNMQQQQQQQQQQNGGYNKYNTKAPLKEAMGSHHSQVMPGWYYSPRVNEQPQQPPQYYGQQQQMMGGQQQQGNYMQGGGGYLPPPRQQMQQQGPPLQQQQQQQMAGMEWNQQQQQAPPPQQNFQMPPNMMGSQQQQKAYNNNYKYSISSSGHTSNIANLTNPSVSPNLQKLSEPKKKTNNVRRNKLNEERKVQRARRRREIKQQQKKRNMRNKKQLKINTNVDQTDFTSVGLDDGNTSNNNGYVNMGRKNSNSPKPILLMSPKQVPSVVLPPPTFPPPMNMMNNGGGGGNGNGGMIYPQQQQFPINMNASYNGSNIGTYQYQQPSTSLMMSNAGIFPPPVPVAPVYIQPNMAAGGVGNNNIITERPFRPPPQPPDFSGVILFTNGEPVAMYNSGGE